MKKYLIFIDIDGTLVVPGEHDMDKRIPKLFDRIQKDGHVVAVVSGRAINAILKIDGIDKAKYLCGLMGNITINAQTKERIIKPKSMDVGELKSLIEDVNNFALKWTYKDDFIEKTYFNDPEISKKYSPIIVEKSDFIKDLDNSNIFQILVDGKISENIINKYPAFDFIEMPGNYFDIVSKGISKATIVNYLKKQYPNHTSVAIGDSANDVDMFNNCSIKIAMGGASKQVKQIATYITNNVEDGGVYYAIENILKI